MSAVIDPVTEPGVVESILARAKPALISTRRLNAYFGRTRVLRNVTLDVRDREITAVIGPSGCGKSTLLRCLNRMHETVADATVEGDVQLEGDSIYKTGLSAIAVRRQIGMVFQRPTPFPTMSIRDNVLAGLRILGTRGPSRSDADAIAEDALRRSGLWDEVKDRLRQSALGISGGQQQRLCIARALAVEPEVLLMDEPCSALDPIATAKIEELIYELKSKYTIVTVTHNMQQAGRISDYTAFFYLGKLIEFGPTTKIFTNPSDRQTEDYITGRFG